MLTFLRWMSLTSSWNLFYNQRNSHVVETDFWLLQKETHQDNIGLTWRDKGERARSGGKRDGQERGRGRGEKMRGERSREEERKGEKRRTMREVPASLWSLAEKVESEEEKNGQSSAKSEAVLFIWHGQTEPIRKWPYLKWFLCTPLPHTMDGKRCAQHRHC